MDNKSTLDRLDTIIGLLKRHLPIIETKLDIIRDPNMEDFENVGKLSLLQDNDRNNFREVVTNQELRNFAEGRGRGTKRNKTKRRTNKRNKTKRKTNKRNKTKRKTNKRNKRRNSIKKIFFKTLKKYR